MKNVIEVTVEPTGPSFIVRVVNHKKQFLRLGAPKSLQDALTEAHEVADFFGIAPAPYVNELGETVQPNIVRDTYDDSKERTREVLIREYRKDDTGALNWNKLVYEEWKNFKHGRLFNSTRQLMEWVLPYYVSGKQDMNWLSLNSKGAWLMALGGVRFTDKQEATLYKMFVDTLGEAECD